MPPTHVAALWRSYFDVVSRSFVKLACLMFILTSFVAPSHAQQCQPPEPPTLNAATGSEFNQITLSWNVTAGVRYSLYTSDTGPDGPFRFLGTNGGPFPEPTMTFTVGAGQTNHTFYYYIEARRDGRTKQSNIASATTRDIDAPSLSATKLNSNQARLSWNVVQGAIYVPFIRI